MRKIEWQDMLNANSDETESQHPVKVLCPAASIDAIASLTRYERVYWKRHRPAWATQCG